MKKRLFPYWAIALCTIMVACSKENEQHLTAPVNGIPNCDTINMKLTANVVSILSTNCYNCHGNGRGFGGVQLDTYTNLKIYVTNGSLIGSIMHASGYSPMPKGGAKLSDCDINKIKAWINRGALNN